MRGRPFVASAAAAAAALAIGALVFVPRSVASDQAPLDVVVTIPVLKDFADRVGGSHVRVLSLLSGLESEHTYSPRPSDLVAVRKAKVLIEVGLGLEVWVGSLVKNAGNKELLVVTTSKDIAVISGDEDASGTPRAGSRGHALGNPHVWLDPDNAKLMVRHITVAFVRVDPAHAADYRNNEATYLRQLSTLQTELIKRLQRVMDRRIVVHHPAWPYFARRFDLQIVGTIITQSGAEPSAHHVQALVKTIRTERVRVIVSEPQLNQKIPQALARETGTRVVVLTPLPGGVAGTETYLDMLRYNVLQLAQALEAS